MWIGDFGDLDQGMDPGAYLQLRRRIRSVMEALSFPGHLSPVSDDHISRIDGELRSGDRNPWSCTLVAEQDVAVSPESVAALFNAKISEIEDQLNRLLESPIGRAAAVVGCRAEVGFAVNALVALAYIHSAEEGLDVRCEDMRQDFNRLEELLRDSGEIGEADDWARSSADPTGVPGVCDMNKDV